MIDRGICLSITVLGENLNFQKMTKSLRLGGWGGGSASAFSFGRQECHCISDTF